MHMVESVPRTLLTPLNFASADDIRVRQEHRRLSATCTGVPRLRPPEGCEASLRMDQGQQGIHKSPHEARIPRHLHRCNLTFAADACETEGRERAGGFPGGQCDEGRRVATVACWLPEELDPGYLVLEVGVACGGQEVAWGTGSAVAHAPEVQMAEECVPRCRVRNDSVVQEVGSFYDASSEANEVVGGLAARVGVEVSGCEGAGYEGVRAVFYKVRDDHMGGREHEAMATADAREGFSARAWFDTWGMHHIVVELVTNDGLVSRPPAPTPSSYPSRPARQIQTSVPHLSCQLFLLGPPEKVCERGDDPELSAERERQSDSARVTEHDGISRMTFEPAHLHAPLLVRTGSSSQHPSPSSSCNHMTPQSGSSTSAHRRVPASSLLSSSPAALKRARCLGKCWGSAAAEGGAAAGVTGSLPTSPPARIRVRRPRPRLRVLVSTM